ncbi:MAG: sterol desaturase family protein [Gammaproteobacteria bacterium]
MQTFILANEPIIRLIAFAGVFGLMAAWELFAPRRTPTIGRPVRWANNLGLIVVGTGLVRIVFPVVATGFAMLVQAKGWGLFNSIAVPGGVAMVGAVLILDFAIYLQHLMFHAVPIFWRIHRVHHADLDFDVTTGVRFHPVEIVLSMLVKLGVVAIIGPPVLAVLVFEIMLNATAIFNHSNAAIPIGLDRWLRWWVVTPDMHRVHHSAIRKETDSNFGFNLPWWDRLFGTYRAQPAAGHHAMIIGLPIFRSRRELRLDRLLVQPMLRPPELSE